jgi:hypothetical protein
MIHINRGFNVGAIYMTRGYNMLARDRRGMIWECDKSLHSNILQVKRVYDGLKAFLVKCVDYRELGTGKCLASEGYQLRVIGDKCILPHRRVVGRMINSNCGPMESSNRAEVARRHEIRPKNVTQKSCRLRINIPWRR